PWAQSPRGVRPPARGGERLAWILAVLGVLVGGAALWRSRASAPTNPELMAFAIAPPAGYLFPDTIAHAPNGRRVLISMRDVGGGYSVWTRSLDDLAIRRLPGTD